jgi:creatinine amidohydrolase
MHAGELEVSILLHTAPDQVRQGYRDGDHVSDDRPYLLVTGMPAYTPTGVIGRPSLATPAKGAALLASLSRSLKSYLDLLV